jgi:hypothetical protein
MARKAQTMHSQFSPNIGDGKSHMEHVIYALEHTRSISRTAIATEVGTFPESVYCVLNNSLGKDRFVRSGFHTCSTVTKEALVFFLPPPICCV